MPNSSSTQSTNTAVMRNLMHLPDIGIQGNSHFAFTDLNNVQIADLLSDYLKSKGLDKK